MNQVVIKNVLYLAVFFVVNVGVIAEPQVTTSIAYYDVSVSTVDGLELALSSRTPIFKNGHIHYGYTDSQIEWNWDTTTYGGICRIFKVSTTLKIKHTLPRLVTESRDKALKKIWRQWSGALMRHERRHAEHALDIARRGERRIRGIPAQTDCELLDAFAHAITVSMDRELKGMDQSYDKRTNAGETEGAGLGRYLLNNNSQGNHGG